MDTPSMVSRRRLLGMLAASRAPAFAQADRPLISHGVTSGDVQLVNAKSARATIWSRATAKSRMTVRWRARGSRRGWKTVTGPFTGAGSDFTARTELTGLPPGVPLEYEVQFEIPQQRGAISEPARGYLVTPPAKARNVHFLWSGDTVGQGWGINPDLGGMRIYETMRTLHPDFFLHSGDNIYADVPVQAEVKLHDGKIWKNLVTEEKSKVAETLPEFRGNYKYNLHDENLKKFQAEVPQLWQWDDHEAMNNWSPGKDLRNNPLYTEKDISVIVERARQAFREYAPIATDATIYRKIGYGPLLDVFVIDLRSYRAANNYNLQRQEGPETVYFGEQQLAWLERELRASQAVWKVVASDMPIGLIVADGKDKQGRPSFENSSNTDGPAMGRELEMARLFTSIHRNQVKNVVWLTTDVHYTTAIYYDPAKAKYTDFSPFWEFVSGPLNAGTFGPGKLDDTFGPAVMFEKAPPAGRSNLAPSEGYQFFGEVTINGKTRELEVRLRDMTGTILFTKALQAA